MAHDWLYNDDIDPLQSEVIEAAKEEVGQIEANGARIVAVLRSRAEEYASQSEKAQKQGAVQTAGEFVRVAKELAYLSKTIGDGRLEELEKKGG